MRPTYRLTIILLVIVALMLSACAQNASPDTKAEAPAKVEPIEGTELNRIILTEDAVQKLDIQTVQVSDVQVDGQQRKVVPYSAVFYDLEGATWVYTNPSALTYIRESISVETIEGDRAILSKGPAAGTAVVTVGAPLLFGTEFGIGK